MSDESSTAHAPKRSKSERSPTTFVTWNCNGLISRCKYNAVDLARLVKETPDIFCFQEVRLKALGASNRGRPKVSEYEIVKDQLEGMFGDYERIWSLADARYAGTLTLVHKRLCVHLGGKTAFTPDAATNLLLKSHNLSRDDMGLPKPAPAKKQSSMKSFFAVKSSPKAELGAGEHNVEGRFQFIRFPDLDFIQTYVPNNGMKEESFKRRRTWDAEMRAFLLNRKKILARAGNPDRPLLWCGDLNIAKEYRDGTHWERTPDGRVVEWWTDEAKCLTPSTKRDANRAPQDTGIPSFTPAERQRFRETLQRADLLDVWREMHPNGVTDSSLPRWERPEWTWRGHLSKNQATFVSKYQGKGQRLDYFLLSPRSILSIVMSCDILGYGEQREGLFCGSDHCACKLELKDPTEWFRANDSQKPQGLE